MISGNQRGIIGLIEAKSFMLTCTHLLLPLQRKNASNTYSAGQEVQNKDQLILYSCK
jgi:hypothetical protein